MDPLTPNPSPPKGRGEKLKPDDLYASPNALAGAYSPIFGHFDNYGLGRQSYLDY